MKKIFLLNADSYNEFEQLIKAYNKCLLDIYIKKNRTLENGESVKNLDGKIEYLLNNQNLDAFNIDINDINSFIDENSELKIIFNGNYIKNEDIDKVIELIDNENDKLLDPIRKILKIAIKKEAHVVFYYILNDIVY